MAGLGSKFHWLTRDWESKILWIALVVFAIFFFTLLPEFRLTRDDANQYLYSIMGGLVSGVVTTVALTYFFQRQEERRNLSQNREELIHLSSAWLEQSKDLLEKMNLDIRPAPDLTTFEERENDIREKVESLVADLAGNRSQLAEDLRQLSYFKYKDFVHRLSLIGQLNKQFGSKAGTEVRGLLSELSIASEKVENRFNVHTSSWAAGTEVVNGQYRIVVTGHKTEAQQMEDLVNQSVLDLQSAFKALEKVKATLDRHLLEI